MEKQINTALNQISKGELLLYYQPILCARTNRIIKAEALIRLKDKDSNIVDPYFIETLSKAGLSYDIDKWVIDNVIKQTSTWSKEYNDLNISINISPNSLMSFEFTEYLIEMKNKIDRPLSIEILENQAVFEEHLINKHLKLLKENEITILLDDFGSGYSALSMLSKLHIDGVKYDIGFSEHLNIDNGLKLFSSCLDISKILKHQTILEGVETKAQYNLALNAGGRLHPGLLYL